MKRIILAEDQVLVREMFCSRLQSLNYHVAGEAANGSEVLELLEYTEADLVITDIEMKEMDGIELTKRLKEKYPDIKVIGLTMHEKAYMLAAMVNAGADGYLMKKSTTKEMETAIKAVCTTGFYACEESRKYLRDLMPKVEKLQQSMLGYKGLTEREIEIITLTAANLSTIEIAQRLFISTKTVNNHRGQVYKKLGIHKISQLVNFANEYGLKPE